MLCPMLAYEKGYVRSVPEGPRCEITMGWRHTDRLIYRSVCLPWRQSDVLDPPSPCCPLMGRVGWNLTACLYCTRERSTTDHESQLFKMCMDFITNGC